MTVKNHLKTLLKFFSYYKCLLLEYNLLLLCFSSHMDIIKHVYFLLKKKYHYNYSNNKIFQKFQGMKNHEVTKKILDINTIDTLLSVL